MDYLLYKLLLLQRREVIKEFRDYGLSEQIDKVNNLPTDIKNSIYKHTIQMNTKVKMTDKDHKNILRAFELMPGLKHEIKLYRGIRKDLSNDDSTLETFPIKSGYISTSLNNSNHSFGPYLYEILIPRGTKVIPTVALSMYPEDLEVLILTPDLYIGKTEIDELVPWYFRIKAIFKNAEYSDKNFLQYKDIINKDIKQYFGRNKKKKSKKINQKY